jgi:hypothetical protein
MSARKLPGGLKETTSPPSASRYLENVGASASLNPIGLLTNKQQYSVIMVPINIFEVIVY